MQVIPLLSGQTNSDDGNSTSIPRNDGRDFILAQFEITGTATVKIQGRMNSGYSWVDIYETSSSEAKQVSRFPNMRAVVPSYTSGSISVALA